MEIEVEPEGRPREESTLSVLAAIVGNLAIAAIKFVAAAITKSSAMLSEGIHSGIRRASKPADSAHPFGHGKELYFWSLIVAISIFGIGGGMSIYEGILHIRNPSPLENPTINYVVLAISAVLEGASFAIAFRQFQRSRGRRSIWTAIRRGKDPSLFTVLFEDSAALLGLGVAFVGVFFGHTLNNPYIDGSASIVIGLILASVALLLAFESKGLLVGESADPEMVEEIRAIAGQDPAVEEVGKALTMYVGAHDVLLNLELEFKPHASAGEIHDSIHRVEDAIAKRHPEVTRIFVEIEEIE